MSNLRTWADAKLEDRMTCQTRGQHSLLGRRIRRRDL